MAGPEASSAYEAGSVPSGLNLNPRTTRSERFGHGIGPGNRLRIWNFPILCERGRMHPESSRLSTSLSSVGYLGFAFCNSVKSARSSLDHGTRFGICKSLPQCSDIKYVDTKIPSLYENTPSNNPDEKSFSNSFDNFFSDLQFCDSDLQQPIRTKAFAQTTGLLEKFSSITGKMLSPPLKDLKVRSHLIQ